MIIKDFKHQTELLVKAFEMGIKDVVQIESVMYFEKMIKTLKKKHIYEQVETVKGNSSYYFFKKQEDKDYFLSEIKSFVEENKISKIATNFGLFMGYPPKACECFPKKTFGVDVVENILINYNGMTFASYAETIDDDFKWLFENKPLNTDYFVIIENKFYENKNGNLKELILKDLEYFKTVFLNEKTIRLKKKKNK